MIPDVIVDLQDVSYRAGSRDILKRINWSIHRGDHWAILGPNGSGKTTLLRLITGHLWPNHGGTVLRLGTQRIDLRVLRQSIGWVTNTLVDQIPPSEPAVNTVVSGRTAQLGLKIFAGLRPTASDIDQAHAQLELLGAVPLAEKPFGVLSQGEKQVVLVARARMAQPLLIILDEPCAGMDPAVRERFLENLSRMLEDSDTPSLLFVTHHVEEILPAVSKTLLLAAGRILQSGRTADVLTRETLTELYGLSIAQLIEHQGRYWPVFGSAQAAPSS